MPVKQCSICAKPPEVLEAINQQIHAGVSPLVIAKQIGIAKSILYRHRQKCLPRRVLETAASFVNALEYVQWPDGTLRNFSNQQIVQESELRGPVVIFRVKYPRNTDQRMLTREEAQALKKEMEADNKPATEAAETNVDIVHIGSEAAPEPEHKLTPRQSERYKWLHAPLGLKHD
jgi:hypothetical protein